MTGIDTVKALNELSVEGMTDDIKNAFIELAVEEHYETQYVIKVPTSGYMEYTVNAKTMKEAVQAVLKESMNPTSEQVIMHYEKAMIGVK